ncbi:DUF3696 domain-containing protein [Candidatus Neomarinimicrobiota bacterium]
MLPDEHPAMLFDKICLFNYRSFSRDQSIDFAPLTFLVGPNSSGKSSVFSAFMLLAQSDLLYLRDWVPVWRGPLIDLGSFSDTVFEHNTRRSIRIGIRLPHLFSSHYPFKAKKKNLGKPIELHFTLRASASNEIGNVKEICLTDTISDVSLNLSFTHGIRGKIIAVFGSKEMELPLPKRDEYSEYNDYYKIITRIVKMVDEEIDKNRSDYYGKIEGIRRIVELFKRPRHATLAGTCQRVVSGRSGPLRLYPVGTQSSDIFYGRPTGDILDKVDLSTIQPPHTNYYWESRFPPQNYLEKLGSLLEALNIASSVTEKYVSGYHSSIHLRDNLTGIESNLIDLGYGASQIIPVLRGCLTRTSGPLFIEQPEIHLHPSAQSVVADLIVNTSKTRQVVVETHSEHLINHARLLIADGKISPEHILINYVDRDSLGSYVTQIGVDSSGDFTNEWPEGFFDERYHDTIKLMRLKANKSANTS